MAQTPSFDFDNDGGSGQHVWTVANNWNPNQLPGTTSFARITTVAGSDPGNVFIFTGSGSLNTANVGTLIVETDSNFWMRATGAGIIPGQSAAPATLSFGSSGGIDYAPTDFFGGDFHIGEPALSGATLTISTQGLLTIRGAENTQMDVHALIAGAGSALLTTLPGEATTKLQVGQSNSASSNFTGGVTLNTATLEIVASSVFSGGSISYGPLGKGTLTLNGGTAVFNAGSVTTIHNDIQLTSDSAILSKHATILVGGNQRTGVGGAHELTTYVNDGLTFQNSRWLSTDSGTLNIQDYSGSSPQVTFQVDSGTSTYGGFVGEGTTAGMIARIIKAGDGLFAASHFRVNQLHVQAGTLRVNNDGSGILGGGSIDHVTASRVNSYTMTLNGSGVPVGKFDLSNNELIIDYENAGTLTVSPLAGTLSTGVGYWIKNAYNEGSWDGTGVMSQHLSSSNSGTYAIGYGEAWVNYGMGSMGSSATATFANQTVDATAVLIRTTQMGDTNLDGITNISDYSRLGANFNLPGLWTEGDLTYDGTVTIADFSLLSNNFNQGTVYRPGPDGLPPLAELFLAMLDSPAIYWESWLWTEFWEEHFAEFEGMNLGPVPPVPAYLRARVNAARGIPEPSMGAIALIVALPRNRRRARRAI